MESPGHEARVQRFSSTAITVGRATDNALCVEDPAASRRHCRISRGPDGWLVEDLGSANGTRVAGARIVGAVAVAPGAVIEIGEVRLRLCGHARASPAPRVQVARPGPEDRERVAVTRPVSKDRDVRAPRGSGRWAVSGLRAWLGAGLALGIAGAGGWASAMAWDLPLVLVAPSAGGCDAADPRLRQAEALAGAAATEPDANQAVRVALAAALQVEALGCGARSGAGAALAAALGRLDSQLLGEHRGPLQALASARDGRVAALEDGGEVVLWDREAPGRALPEASGAQALARSEDGRWLVVGDVQGRLRWWELAGDAVLAAQTEAPTLAGAPRVLAFDRAGRTIRVDEQGRVELWTRAAAGSGATRWTRTTTLQAWPGVTEVQVASARVLVRGAGRAALWQLDPAGVARGAALPLASGAAITAAALDEAGAQVVTGDAGGTVTRWRLGRRARPEPLTAHAGAVHAVVWVDGAVVSVGADEALRVAELDRRVRREGPPLVLVADTPAPVDRLVVVGAGRWLVGSGPAGAIVTWDLKERGRRLPASLRPGHRGPVTALAAGDGWVVTGGADGAVRAWDLAAEAPAEDGDLVARACRALGWSEPGCQGGARG